MKIQNTSAFHKPARSSRAFDFGYVRNARSQLFHVDPDNVSVQNSCQTTRQLLAPTALVLFHLTVRLILIVYTLQQFSVQSPENECNKFEKKNFFFLT